MIPVFQGKEMFRAMTAAERQRRCRAGGKGRHRGRRLTRAEGMALREAEARAATQGQAPPVPSVPPEPHAPSASPASVVEAGDLMASGQIWV